jgi:hypothetical protein
LKSKFNATVSIRTTFEFKWFAQRYCEETFSRKFLDERLAMFSQRTVTGEFHGGRGTATGNGEMIGADAVSLAECGVSSTVVRVT